MKRILTIILAAAAVCACKLDEPYNYELTSDRLEEYARTKLSEFILVPGLELGAYLFAEEYMNADDAGRQALLSEYHLAGKFHQAAPGLFDLDGFGEIQICGKTLEELFWELGWKKEGDTWISPYGTHLSVRRDENGIITDMTAEGGTYTDRYGRISAHFTLPDGQFTFTNPVFAEMLEFIGSDYMSRGVDNLHLTYNGSFRMETSIDGRILDWVVLSAVNQDHFDCQSSR